ncbi:hypothetical protein Vadar_016997 [Vaccinium darrowii]|uniref:Uncharacterized protein n=1 Tax=Vaccinium darrowii TaxID=229202 RepID=A0ACB7Z5V0_9ERIC|nr:hypothetical protein Vadar_016997 [Vaccinium darrowii]
MNPIPTWVRRLWDVWDLRVLVLLSFTLQLILSIFGNRRKYKSSLWINVLVWSAYLMADWVATVALGKLSDVQGDPEKSNVLWVIWAPLLLLHLGGPDTITAYSLEDNQLWLRHLLGLVVQLFVAIYVILMSWKNSWFSFMSLPALVAGIIKYGERTWVLKSVSGNNLKDTIPFGDLRDKYAAMRHEYARVLILAHFQLKEFMMYLGGEGDSESYPQVIEHNMDLDSVEVSMGLLYDLLYTKASCIYSKGGFILRCISFGCTVTVLIGLIFRIGLLKTREEDEIDMAITGVLILGALVLEIYAAIVIFSSHWFMLWLIKQGRGEWVIWLNQKFPWLFNKEKSWSKMMWQFDLLGYCVKVSEPADVQKPSRKIIRSVLGCDYEIKWNIYQHKTAYSVHPLVYDAILEYYYSKIRCGSRIPNIVTPAELEEFQTILEPRYHRTAQLLQEKIYNLHLATQICYHLENEWEDAAGGDQDIPSGHSNSSSAKEVCKALSDYMMYLLLMHPLLLPSARASTNVEALLKYPDGIVGNARDITEACHFYLERNRDVWSRVAEGLKGKGKVKRWEILKLMWWGFLRDAADSPINGHFQQLRQGGELLTFMFFVNVLIENDTINSLGPL